VRYRPFGEGLQRRSTQIAAPRPLAGTPAFIPHPVAFEPVLAISRVER
jgi:hypothetical protein